VSNYDKFVAELQREVTALANKNTKIEWQETNADLEQLQIYWEEIDDYDGGDESDDGDFYSSSNKTLFETEVVASQLVNKINKNWQLDLDFIKVTGVDTLLDINDWQINYGVILKDYDINLVAIVIAGNVEIKVATINLNYDDADFELYTNFEHYRLLAILKK
jgi:hypothetical protein